MKTFNIKVPTVVYVEKEFQARDLQHAKELFEDDELGSFDVEHEDTSEESFLFSRSGYISSPNEPMLDDVEIKEVDRI